MFIIILLVKISAFFYYVTKFLLIIITCSFWTEFSFNFIKWINKKKNICMLIVKLSSGETGLNTECKFMIFTSGEVFDIK